MHITIVDEKSVMCDGRHCNVVDMITSSCECGSCPVYAIYHNIERALFGDYVKDDPIEEKKDQE